MNITVVKNTMQKRAGKNGTPFELDFDDILYNEADANTSSDFDYPEEGETSPENDQGWYNSSFKAHKQIFDRFLKTKNKDTFPENPYYRKRVKDLEVGVIDPRGADGHILTWEEGVPKENFKYVPYKQWLSDVGAALKAKDHKTLGTLLNIWAYKGVAY